MSSDRTAFLVLLAGVAGFFAGAFVMGIETRGERCQAHFAPQTIEWHRCVERLSDGDLMSQILEDAQ